MCNVFYYSEMLSELLGSVLVELILQKCLGFEHWLQMLLMFSIWCTRA